MGKNAFGGVRIQKPKTLLDVDVRAVIERLEDKYGIKLPRKVITIDYDEDQGDLFIRFKNADSTEGESTSDGKAILHYDKKGKVAVVEITDLATR